jgi:pyrroloquinoline quinone biosynthesis protein B
MYFGKEAMNADNIQVYVMPRMLGFLNNNGPWNLLVENSNISLLELNDQISVKLNDNLSIQPFLVPHRDEFSETVGYKIIGPNKSAIFIPDIDKWSKWPKDLQEAISEVDFAFIDGTFYSGEEISYRNISEIPHPFIIETLDLLSEIPYEEKQKVHFIHFNHTNPVLIEDSPVKAYILGLGYKISELGLIIDL